MRYPCVVIRDALIGKFEKNGTIKKKIGKNWVTRFDHNQTWSDRKKLSKNMFLNLKKLPVRYIENIIKTDNSVGMFRQYHHAYFALH